MKTTRQSLYLIASDCGCIKVGISKDPESRMASLNQYSPRRLRLIKVYDVCHARRVERLSHQLLGKYLVKNEWFETSEKTVKEAVNLAIETVLETVRANLLFGNTIKELRLKKDLTLEQVAKTLGVTSRTSVWNWESGINPPSLINLFKLADLYEVEPRWLKEQFEKSQRKGGKTNG